MELLAAAYVRGYCARTGENLIENELLAKPLETLSEEERKIIAGAGKAAGLKMYRFKDHEELPRVRKVMGFLRGIMPENLLDVGSGRGAFLFRFLSGFPYVPVTSYDLLDHRVTLLNDIAAGGIGWLTALQRDICTDETGDDAFDVVTLLEVLEHIPDVHKAVRNAVRLARRYVVVTVPSVPDDNPEHIHFLTKERLTALFAEAGCTSLRFDAVHGHLFMIATIGK